MVLSKVLNGSLLVVIFFLHDAATLLYSNENRQQSLLVLFLDNLMSILPLDPSMYDLAAASAAL